MRSFVLQGPKTWTYLQERIAKKNAPIKSSQRVFSNKEMDKAWNRFKMEAVKAG
jgi:hypothetical protein